MKKNVHDDPLLEKWLTEFKKESTQYTYYHALTNFKKIIGIEDLGRYVAKGPDVTSDIRKFLKAYDGKPSKTVSTYIGAIRTFLLDNNVKIPENEWRNIRRRGFMPKRTRSITQDKKNSKSELKQILNYADIKTRALVLFLVSSGARIGETLQLKDDDLNLNNDPPKATIRDEYTKGGYGGRNVYFSYEARDTINDWLRIRDTTKKHMKNGTFKSNRVFPWGDNTSRKAWNLAIQKAGLDVKDVKTKRRIYHLHALRKFFRSNIGLDDKITNCLMGHLEYLDDAYLRLEEKGDIAKEYKKAMPNVSIFTVEDATLREQTNTLEEKIERLEQENQSLKTRLNGWGNQTSELQSLRDELEELRSLVKTQLTKKPR